MNFYFSTILFLIYKEKSYLCVLLTQKMLINENETYNLFYKIILDSYKTI